MLLWSIRLRRTEGSGFYDRMRHCKSFERLFVDMRHAHRKNSGNVAVSERHKYMIRTPEDGSSVIVFSFRAIAGFCLF